MGCRFRCCPHVFHGVPDPRRKFPFGIRLILKPFHSIVDCARGGGPRILTVPRTWENGDAVEGWKAGALWDFYDTVPDGSDRYGTGSFVPIWRAIADHHPNTFQAFLDAWQRSSPTMGAIWAAYQNTVVVH
ncbi:hypothetical protein JCM17961_31340 [Endothiovibrio diazotrophicus]